jgi:hypothetical protein
MIGYPITYGDDISDRKMLSDYIVDAAKNERVQKHLGSVAAALITYSVMLNLYYNAQFQNFLNKY